MKRARPRAVVDVADLQRRWRGAARAAAVARLVLDREGRSGRLAVALVDDDEMSSIHRVYLGIDGPTDVVSFPLDDAHDDVIGEVVVSTDTAAREAKARGISLDEEVLRYVVHGTLHLLGYDDHERADRERMHSRQEALLAEAIGPRRVARKPSATYARRRAGGKNGRCSG